MICQYSCTVHIVYYTYICMCRIEDALVKARNTLPNTEVKEENFELKSMMVDPDDIAEGEKSGGFNRQRCCGPPFGGPPRCRGGQQ